MYLKDLLTYFRISKESRNTRAWVLFGGLLAMIFAVQKVYDPDTWWHLASGKLILQGELPHTNLFSHTWPQYPWKNTEWLFDAVLRLWEQAGGVVGIQIFQMLLVSLVFMLTCDTMFRKSDGRILAVLFVPLIVMALIASCPRFSPRPHLVTYVGLALIMNLWEHRPSVKPAWYFLLGLAWANFHAGVIFGFIVICLRVFSSVVAGDREEAIKTGYSAGAFFAGSLMTPSFYYIYFFPFETLGVNNKLHIILEEFTRPAVQTEPIFFVLTVLGIIVSVTRLYRRDFFPMLLLATFLPLSIYAVRIVPKYIILLLPTIYHAHAEILRKLAEQNRWRFFSTIVAVFIVLAAFAVTHLKRAIYPINPFGTGVHHLIVPEAAADYIAKHELPGRMYNDWGQGGYLMWRLYPQHKVFMDGRYIAAYPLEFYSELKKNTNKWAWPALMDKYGIDFAVVERFDAGDIKQPDTSNFFESMGWHLVLIDGKSYLFIRPDSKTSQHATERFKIIASGDSREKLLEKGRLNPVEMRRELSKIDFDRFIWTGDYSRFAAGAFGAGDIAKAERILQSGINRFPDSSILHFEMGLLLKLSGHIESALSAYRKSVQLDPNSSTGQMAAEEIKRLEPF